MHPLLLARLRRQRGLIRRNEAVDCGVGEHELEVLLRRGELVVVRHGVYALGSDWAALDPYVGQPLQRARAAHLTMVTDHVMSHDSAARELGLAVLRPAVELVHITRPDVRGSRTEHGVKHHGAVFRDDQVIDVEGIPVLDRARTAVDMAREHGIQGGLPTFDSALRAGVPRSELVRAFAPMRSWPHVRAVRACAELADAGAENPGETLARLLVLELGVGPVETQFPVPTPRGVAWCDLRVGCHLFEFDGRLKFLRADRGGVATRPVEDILWDEKRRQTDVCGNGLGMSRIVWQDFWPPHRAPALARLAQEVALSRARFGDELPPRLVEFARHARSARTSRTA
jgi:hypothetical protein